MAADQGKTLLSTAYADEPSSLTTASFQPPFQKTKVQWLLHKIFTSDYDDRLEAPVRDF